MTHSYVGHDSISVSRCSCTATHFSALQYTATHCNTHCNTLQHTPTAIRESILSSTRLTTGFKAIRRYTLQHTATQHTATHRNTLPHITTHCNTLQHTATHCNLDHHRAPEAAQHSATHTLQNCNTLQHNTLQHTATHCHTLQPRPPSRSRGSASTWIFKVSRSCAVSSPLPLESVKSPVSTLSVVRAN